MERRGLAVGMAMMDIHTLDLFLFHTQAVSSLPCFQRKQHCVKVIENRIFEALFIRLQGVTGHCPTRPVSAFHGIDTKYSICYLLIGYLQLSF